MINIALITGISGQDGSYLSELLLDKGYEVHGIVRRIAFEDPINRLWRISHILDKIILHIASIENYGRLLNVIEKVQPTECYHLAAQSYVSYSFDDSVTTFNTNINGTLNILYALKEKAPKCKCYFAGSSEMFGNAEETPQSESTSFHPRSAYGISKVVGFDLTRNFRNIYNMFACSGILFNHESPRRSLEFVTRKITNAVARIKLGLQEYVCLGNLDSARDWGYAGDYVQAIWQMLQQNTPEDYVIGTGVLHTVRDLAKIAFEYKGLNWENHVRVNRCLYRPSEIRPLRGDCRKAENKLNWCPSMEFKQLIYMMVENDIALIQLKS